MTTFKPIQTPATIGALLLGNFAAFWGSVVAPIYIVGFGLMFPNAQRGIAASVSVLPLSLPLIGLLLGGLALAFARYATRPSLVPCVLSLVLNGVAMALALVLWVLHRGAVLWPF